MELLQHQRFAPDGPAGLMLGPRVSEGGSKRIQTQPGRSEHRTLGEGHRGGGGGGVTCLSRHRQVGSGDTPDTDPLKWTANII